MNRSPCLFRILVGRSHPGSATARFRRSDHSTTNFTMHLCSATNIKVHLHHQGTSFTIPAMQVDKQCLPYRMVTDGRICRRLYFSHAERYTCQSCRTFLPLAGRGWRSWQRWSRHLRRGASCPHPQQPSVPALKSGCSVYRLSAVKRHLQSLKEIHWRVHKSHCPTSRPFILAPASQYCTSCGNGLLSH